jgi:hypothetical protein
MAKIDFGERFRGELVSVATEQAELLGDEFTGEYRSRLIAAFEAVDPETHAEAVDAFALGTCPASDSRGLVREYVKRRESIGPAPGYCPVFSLRYWGVPFTYGIILYHEQMWAFFREVYDVGFLEAARLEKHMLKESLKGTLTFAGFAENLNEKYRGFSREELERIYGIAAKAVGTAKYYFQCSTMVDRGLERTRAKS